MSNDEYVPQVMKLDEHESKAAKKILTALVSEFGESEGALIDTCDWSAAEHGEISIEGTVDGETFEMTLRVVGLELDPLYDEDDEPEEDE